MLRRVKLTKGARTEGLERGIDLGLFSDPNQDVRGKTEDGKDVDLDGGAEVVVNNREYHRLKTFGLIDVEATRLLAPAADQPEADKAALEAKRDLMQVNADTRSGLARGDDNLDDVDPDLDAVRGPVHDERGPSGTNRGVHPGGVGHQEGETEPTERDEDKDPSRVQKVRGDEPKSSSKSGDQTGSKTGGRTKADGKKE
jgi:hypothetical protein